MNDLNKEESPASPPAKEKQGVWERLWDALGLWLIVLICLGLIGILMALISFEKSTIAEEQRLADLARRMQPVDVVTTILKPTTISDSIRLPGMISAWIDTDISAQVGGRVMAVPVQDGAMVRKGDLLCKIDETDYQIAIKRAEEAYRFAEKTLQRTQELVKKDIRTEADLGRDRNAHALARANLEAAALALSRTSITSPIDGQVDDIIPEVGELLKVGDKITTVLDTHKVKVEVGIPEADVDEVRTLKTCKVVIDAVSNGYTVTGTKTYLSVKPIQEARVYSLRLAVENKDGRLRPGMFADAHVVKAVREEALQVPLFAILTRGEKHLVFVAEERTPSGENGTTATTAVIATVAPAETEATAGTTACTACPTCASNGGKSMKVAKQATHVARQRFVELGIIQGRYAEIRSGLKPGEQVIIVGQRGIAEDTPLAIRDTVDDATELLR